MRVIRQLEIVGVELVAMKAEPGSTVVQAVHVQQAIDWVAKLGGDGWSVEKHMWFPSLKCLSKVGSGFACCTGED